METETLTNPAPEANTSPAKNWHWLIWLFLALIMVALVAGGIYYWQHKKVNDLNKQVNSLNSRISTLQSQLSTGQSASASTPSSTQTNSYLNITGLGVKLTINSLTGLKYVSNTASTATLYTDALAVYCDPHSADAPLGTLIKVNGTYPSNANASTAPAPLVKQFSGFYIAYRAPQQACTSNTTGSQLQTQQETLVRSIVTSVALL